MAAVPLVERACPKLWPTCGERNELPRSYGRRFGCQNVLARSFVRRLADGMRSAEVMSDVWRAERASSKLWVTSGGRDTFARSGGRRFGWWNGLARFDGRDLAVRAGLRNLGEEIRRAEEKKLLAAYARQQFFESFSSSLQPALTSSATARG